MATSTASHNQPPQQPNQTKSSQMHIGPPSESVELHNPCIWCFNQPPSDQTIYVDLQSILKEFVTRFIGTRRY